MGFPVTHFQIVTTDPERVSAALARFGRIDCEMQPGAGLYFHGNLLHASEANRSPHPRWALICCYNTKSNDPYKESHHPRYTPLIKAPHSAIKQAGDRRSAADKEFLDPKRDRTTGAGKQA